VVTEVGLLSPFHIEAQAGCSKLPTHQPDIAAFERPISFEKRITLREKLLQSETSAQVRLSQEIVTFA
jgi:hypothetical protein